MTAPERGGTMPRPASPPKRLNSAEVRTFVADLVTHPRRHTGETGAGHPSVVHEIEVARADLLEATGAVIKGAPVRYLTTYASEETQGRFVVRSLYHVRSRHAVLSLLTRLEPGEALPSVTPQVPAADWSERALSELQGIPVEGHPDPRAVFQHRGWPIRQGTAATRPESLLAAPGSLHPLRRDFPSKPAGAIPRLAQDPPYDFLRIEGDGVCEVPVGPIHAGVIEPGHFRFTIAGEPVLNLEIRLGYAHKGVEKLHEGRTPNEALFLASRTSGDNSVGHSLAFCHAVEALATWSVPLRAKNLRVVLLELERITHHLGDIGGVLLDVAFNFGASQFAILREDMFRLNARLTGSRLLFGCIAIGGVAQDLTPSELDDIIATIDRVTREASRILKISLASASVVDRLDGTGTLSSEHALRLGVVGPAARASGLDIDARRDLPHDAYSILKVQVSVEKGGDVMARTRVKAAEIEESARLIHGAAENLRLAEGQSVVPDGFEPPARVGDRLPATPFRAPSREPSIQMGPRIPNDTIAAHEMGLGVTEAHRGEVLYAVQFDESARIERCHLRDPSTMNWRALEVAVPSGNIIADFPVINKSFNLSYSGNDR
ncbi:MAG: hydrogenase large subunit [Thermoplasmatota archaeon]